MLRHYSSAQERMQAQNILEHLCVLYRFLWLDFFDGRRMLSRNAPIDLDAFFIRQAGPARHFFKGAQAAAAYIVAQHSGAMPDTGAFRGNFFC